MQRTCPKCKGVTQGNSTICVHCGASLTYVLPDNIAEPPVYETPVSHNPQCQYHEHNEKQAILPEAITSFVLSLVSIFLFGPITAIISLVYSSKAFKKLGMGANDKSSRGLATAGKIISIIVLVFWAFIIGIVLLAELTPHN